jgi:hypothetical protein
VSEQGFLIFCICTKVAGGNSRIHTRVAGGHSRVFTRVASGHSCVHRRVAGGHNRVCTQVAVDTVAYTWVAVEQSAYVRGLQ